jgi:hypothetical protein
MQPLEPAIPPGDHSSSPATDPISPSKQESSSLLVASLRRRLAQACVQVDSLRRSAEENSARVEFLKHALELEQARRRRLQREFREDAAIGDLHSGGADDLPRGPS